MSRKIAFKWVVAVVYVISLAWVQYALAMEPDEARDRLCLGNQRFLAEAPMDACECDIEHCVNSSDCEECKCGCCDCEQPPSCAERDGCNIKTPQGMQNIACGQHPFATIISCSDSRIVPEIIFDVGAEDIFVIRVAGNTLDNIALGSIEYGVEHAHTPALVVLGHQHCGAVTATVKARLGELKVEDEPKYIRRIIGAIMPPVKKTIKTHPGHTCCGLIDESIKENVKYVIKQLKKKSNTVRHLIHEGHLEIYGAIAYLNGDPGAGINPGEVIWLDGHTSD